MEAIWPHIIDVVVTAGGATIMALIGFVWRISHKVSDLEQRLQNQRQLTARDLSEVKRDIERIYEHVDKNREWSTSRMMSIVKELPTK